MIEGYSYKKYTTPSGNTNIYIFKKKKDHSETKCYIKQKLLGISLLLIGIFVVILTMDGTILLFSVPVGIALILSKEKVMTF